MLKNFCPRCGSDDITPVGETHYVCNNPECIDEEGNRTQFHIVEDDKVLFPYNQIFVNREKHEFYRTPYLDPNVTKETFRLK